MNFKNNLKANDFQDFIKIIDGRAKQIQHGD